MSEPGREAAPSDATTRLLRGGSIYTLATAAQLSAGLLVLPALTRILDADEYGTVTAALVIHNLLGVSIGLGLPAAITRAHFHADDRRIGGSSAPSLIWATAAGAFVCAVLLDLAGPHWAGVYEELEYGATLRLAVYAAAGFAVLQAGQSLLRAQERPGPYVVGAVIATAGAQLAGLAGAALGGPSGYMAGMAIGIACAAAYAIAATGSHRFFHFDREAVTRNLRIGLPIVPNAVAMYVIAAGDRVVVERLEGLVEVARYHVAYLIGFLVLLLGTAINNAWMPIVFGAAENDRWRVLAETTAQVLRVTALVAAAVAIGAPVALEAAAPASYEIGSLDEITGLVAVSVLPFVWYLACSQVLLWRAKTWWFLAVTPAVAAANIVLCVVLVPEHGLIGAAVATVIAYLLLAAALTAVTRRVAALEWPWREAAISTTIAASACAIAFAIPDDGAWLGARAIASVVIIGVLARSVLGSARPRPLS